MYFKNIKAYTRSLSKTFVLCYVFVSSSQRSLLENEISADVFHRTYKTEKKIIIYTLGFYIKYKYVHVRVMPALCTTLLRHIRIKVNL